MWKMKTRIPLGGIAAVQGDSVFAGNRRSTVRCYDLHRGPTNGLCLRRTGSAPVPLSRRSVVTSGLTTCSLGRTPIELLFTGVPWKSFDCGVPVPHSQGRICNVLSNAQERSCPHNSHQCTLVHM